MALTVTHAYVSAIPDAGDTTLVQPSDWNANHGLTGVLDVANGGTGVASLGTGIATFLGTPTSANLAAALTDETGTGAAVFANTPTLIAPILGTPTSGTLTNCTLPIGGVSGLAAGVATFLATPSSANLISAVTDETGTGALVFANTPTLVTPILGTPTSGNLANCTGYPVGSISGTVPATAGGTGQTTYAKGDILASPGSNTLNKLPVGTDTFVLTADAASTNGIKWAAASSGGTPAGSGTEIQYRNSTAFGAMAGTAWDNTNRSLTMTGATVTTSNPVLNMTQTWNAGAVTFTGINLNVTSTASAATSKLIDLQVSAVSAFNVSRSFLTTVTGSTNGTGVSAFTVKPNGASVAFAQINDNGTMVIDSDVSTGTNILQMKYNGAVKYTFAYNGIANAVTAFDAPLISCQTNGVTMSFVTDAVFASWQNFIFGGKVSAAGAAAVSFTFSAGSQGTDAAVAQAMTLKVQSVVAGTSNVAGADWTFQGSLGTGTGAGGDIVFKLAPAGTTGTSQNAAAEVIRIQNTGRVKFSNAANFSANGSVATVLGSLGPTGSSTTVTKWLTFVDNGGTTRYVPCF